MPMSELVLDSTFANCHIEGVAGRGGMGVVYRATQLPLGRRVALKVVAPERAADPLFHARFERETRLAAAIDHPNVIPVYEAGEQDGRLYLVMRWVEGGDLQGLIASSGRLDPALAAAVVAQVGSGLEAAHAAGLVHRDVKPANVLLAGDEGALHVYLSDFGLTLDASSDTRLTQTGDLLGTVEFMAPEQLEAEPVSARTDVYALGCVLYTALSGRPPFSRGTYAATMLAQLTEPPAAAVRDRGGARGLRRRGGPGAREAARGPLPVGSRPGGGGARGGRHPGGRDDPCPRRPRRPRATAIPARSRRRCRPPRSAAGESRWRRPAHRGPHGPDQPRAQRARVPRGLAAAAVALAAAAALAGAARARRRPFASDEESGAVTAARGARGGRLVRRGLRTRGRRRARGRC